MFQFLQKFISPPTVPTTAQVPEKPKIGEVAWASASFFSGQSPQVLWDDDHLKATKGHRIYRTMLEDDQVKAAYGMVVDLITGRSFRFVPEEDTPEQERIIEFLSFNIEKFMRGTFTNAMRQVLTSKAHGYSVNEVCIVPGDWDGKPSWLLKAINIKPAHTFRFEVDEFGTIHKMTQDQNGNRKQMDPSKFIINVTNSDQDPIYGVSDLIPAYRHWWSKQNIIRFRNIHLERLAGGLLIVKMGESVTMAPPEVIALDSSLRNASAGTSMRLPRGVELEVIQSSGADDFERGIDASDTAIARSLLVPNLLGITPQKSTGTFAQSKVQEKMFFRSLLRQGNDLADTLNEQLWGPLVWWNFGEENYPRMVFDPMTDEEKREVVVAFTDAIKGGAIRVVTNDDETKNRTLLGYEPLEPDQEEELKNDRDEQARPEDAERAEATAKREIKAIDDPPSRINANPTKPQPTPWEDRINFKELGEELDAIEKQFNMELSGNVDVMFSEVTGKIPVIMNEFKGKQFDEDKFRESMLKLISPEAKKAYNTTIRKNLERGYNTGRESAILEINTAKRDDKLQDPARTAINSDYDKNHMVKNLVLRFVNGINPDTAVNYFAAKGFKLTGDVSDDFRKSVETVVINGIRDEKSVNDIVKELELMMKPWIGEFDSRGRRINIAQRIATIVRTNLTEAFNQARLAVYNAPEIGEFVQSYQYTAILDTRTTDFCVRAHGKIYSKRDPQWNKITPPNHFNCRSTLIPITELDEHTLSQPLPDDVQPAVGFGKE